MQQALAAGRARREKLLQKMQGTPLKAKESATPAHSTPAQTPAKGSRVEEMTPGSAMKQPWQNETPAERISRKRETKATPIFTSPDLPTPGLKLPKHDEGNEGVQDGRRQLFHQDATTVCTLTSFPIVLMMGQGLLYRL